jgi:fumarate reductase subunit D
MPKALTVIFKILWIFLLSVFFVWMAYFLAHLTNFLLSFAIESINGYSNIYTFSQFEKPYLQVFNLMSFLGLLFLTYSFIGGLEGKVRKILEDSFFSGLFTSIKETWSVIVFSVLYLLVSLFILMGIVDSEMMQFWIENNGNSIALFFILASIITYILFLYVRNKLLEWEREIIYIQKK